MAQTDNIAAENYAEALEAAVEEAAVEQQHADNEYAPAQAEAAAELAEATEPEAALDTFSLLGDNIDDAEQASMYQDYLQLVELVKAENLAVAAIKTRILDICNDECRTMADCRELQQLQVHLARKHIKLQQLMYRAIRLQNFGSARHYRELPFATSFAEDMAMAAVDCVHGCAPDANE